MSNWFKRNGIHLVIAGLFIAICSVYFSPALQGKILPQYDVQQAGYMAKEIIEYKKDGRGPLWTNSMFAGMPSYQIWVQYPYNITTYIISFFTNFFPNPIGIVVLFMLGAYLLFNVLRVNPWLAAAGAIAVTFTTYNFVLIEAGHNNQALAMSFFAPVLAGILLTLRKNYLTGATITAFSLALIIRSNHVQMTYYLFISLLILIGIELYHAIKSKQTNDFLKSFAYLAGATVLAIAVNAGTLWTTYEYGKESIRGKSNLVTDKAQPTEGVDRDYAYRYSQGVGESITFLVPGAYGGSSSSQLPANSNVEKTLSQRIAPEQATEYAKQFSTYWGGEEGTSGPNYFGAIICFLFVLGLFIVNDRIKWWVLAASLLSLFLSFGRNLSFISDLFFNYFPLYNKFRTVESNLAITEFLFPILAILAIKEIAFHKQDPKVLVKKFLYSLYITGGILLIIIVAPTLFFTFRDSNYDQLIQSFTQASGGDRSFAESIGKALLQDRASIARMDAIRSLVFVLIGAGLVWALIKQKLKAEYIFILLAVAILVDMWGVDRRFVKTEQFQDKSALYAATQPRQVDQLIMRDPNPDYRVLDLTAPSGPFSDARPSNFHKSIGGYHAAKLKRFQEVLDKQFTNSLNEDVLDMLNTKYVITSDETGQSQKIQNRSTAAGNAWFVPNVIYVKNAEQEMNAISSFDPRKVAYVNEEFKPLIDGKKLGYDANSSIKLTNYNPDHMTYEYTAGHDVLAVFSEIWYDKGWNAYVDGAKIPYFRADYILRAAQLPGGNHKLEFKFEPSSYYTGEKISLIASILLIAGIVFAIYTETKKHKVAVAA